MKRERIDLPRWNTQLEQGRKDRGLSAEAAKEPPPVEMARLQRFQGGSQAGRFGMFHCIQTICCLFHPNS